MLTPVSVTLEESGHVPLNPLRDHASSHHAALAGFMRLHHGFLCHVSDEDWRRLSWLPEVSVAPFTTRLCCLWDEKVVIYGPGVHWSSCVHEIGHVLADRNRPDQAEEWDWFGWENALVRHIGAPVSGWTSENHDYWVRSDGTTLGDLRRAERKRLLVERADRARELGLVTADGVPLAVR